MLLQGPLGTPEEFARRDTDLRARYAGGFGGLPAEVWSAGHATARQFAGDVGTATPNSDGVVYASVVFLEGWADHADLTAGRWERPEQRPVEATLAESAAATIGLRIGDHIPIVDRLTGRTSQVTLVGTWRPRDADEPYWQLLPLAVRDPASQSATYGPLVLSRSWCTRVA